MLKPFTVQVVNASDVFFGHEPAWAAFGESDPDCSWGDNNRTLVSRDFLAECLHDIDTEDESLQAHLDVVIAEVRALESQVYIDLEN